MYRLDITDLAHEDLENIIGYITKNLAALEAATGFVEEVAVIYTHLQQNPYQFPQCYDTHLAKEGYRRALIKNYLLVYKVFDDTQMVVGYRFFHGTQNYVDKI
jgi:plasmid stabilization system protein ParE